MGKWSLRARVDESQFSIAGSFLKTWPPPGTQPGRKDSVSLQLHVWPVVLGCQKIWLVLEEELSWEGPAAHRRLRRALSLCPLAAITANVEIRLGRAHSTLAVGWRTMQFALFAGRRWDGGGECRRCCSSGLDVWGLAGGHGTSVPRRRSLPRPTCQVTRSKGFYVFSEISLLLLWPLAVARIELPAPEQASPLILLDLITQNKPDAHVW